jgi:uncharacterized protein (TIGR03083 family)
MTTLSEGPAEQAVLQRSTLDRVVAMELAATEYERFAAAVGDLSTDDWGRPTDCPAWDVRQLACHVVGMAELAADPAEEDRQQGLAFADATANDVDLIDALTAVQVRERQTWSPAAIVAGLRAVAPRAVLGRTHTPEGALSTVMPDPFELNGRQEWWATGYLVDVILTRDVWMHRIDLCRATGRRMQLTPGHDGVIVADVVDEWARRHGAVFRLILTGPAGGAFMAGPDVDGDTLELDAVEFCRLVSGRGTATGLLATHVPF